MLKHETWKYFIHFHFIHSFTADVYMTITRLEGSSSLTITVNMNGESEYDSTRVFTESKENSHHLIDYPFDFQIRLKV